MHSRAADLIRVLGLSPHPEGGYFRQIYRSDLPVQPLEENRPQRVALTSIYFLLVEGEVSRWHRVLSDEAWHFYEGEPLELVSMTQDHGTVTQELLGPVGENVCPVRVVPAGHWQAARSLGAYTLAGCSVGPGFDFADFQLLGELPDEADKVRQQRPKWASLL